MIRYISWFAGIGGFDLALTGFTRVGACEIDPFARRVYAARFGHEPIGDICDVTPESIPEADLWCGGFPCQDLSVAGGRAGFGGERSSLVFCLLDLAAARRPTWLLLENVPGLLSVHGGADFGALLAALDERGYVGAWRVLDAQNFGVPQRRKRVFILARLDSVEGPDPREILLESESVRRDPAPVRASRADVAHAVTTRTRERRETSDTYVIAPPVRLSTCRGEANGEAASECLIFDPEELGVRRLLPVEAERLQGFPDDWTALGADASRYRVLGNAVCVPVVEWIARRLRAAIS